MRGEKHAGRFVCQTAEALLNLRRVAVPGHPISINAIISLAEKQVLLRLAARPGDTGFTIGNHRLA